MKKKLGKLDKLILRQLAVLAAVAVLMAVGVRMSEPAGETMGAEPKVTAAPGKAESETGADTVPGGTESETGAEAVPGDAGSETGAEAVPGGTESETGADTVPGDAGSDTGGETVTPEPTKEPEATRAPEPTKKPEATKAPEPTKKPEATKAPEATKKPEATKAPEPTKKPEATRAPEPTKKPEATKAPEPTKKPEATKAPESTQSSGSVGGIYGSVTDSTGRMDLEFIHALKQPQDGEWLTADGAVKTMYYMQTDSRWGSKIYGGEDTIAKYACGPTSMAIVISSLTNIRVDPVQMSEWANKNGYWYPKSGSLHTIVRGAASAFGLTAEGIGNDSATTEKVKEALLRGDMLVALMGKGHFTKGGHFIVLRGITSEGKILVADCNSRENTLQEWDLSLLQNEAKYAADGGPFWIIRK